MFFTAEGMGSIPGQGSKILQDAPCGQKKLKQNQELSLKKKIGGLGLLLLALNQAPMSTITTMK